MLDKAGQVHPDFGWSGRTGQSHDRHHASRRRQFGETTQRGPCVGQVMGGCDRDDRIELAAKGIRHHVSVHPLHTVDLCTGTVKHVAVDVDRGDAQWTIT